MNGTNCNPTSMQPIAMGLIPAEQILDIYKKIIRELIGACELDEESTDSEPLPAPLG
jgi:hypothetical protein